jgi:hypothetical protein
MDFGHYKKLTTHHQTTTNPQHRMKPGIYLFHEFSPFLEQLKTILQTPIDIFIHTTPTVPAYADADRNIKIIYTDEETAEQTAKQTAEHLIASGFAEFVTDCLYTKKNGVEIPLKKDRIILRRL